MSSVENILADSRCPTFLVIKKTIYNQVYCYHALSMINERYARQFGSHFVGAVKILHASRAADVCSTYLYPILDTPLTSYHKLAVSPADHCCRRLAMNDETIKRRRLPPLRGERKVLL